MSSHNPVPEYYYKNFALAAERMARTAGSITVFSRQSWPFQITEENRDPAL